MTPSEEKPIVVVTFSADAEVRQKLESILGPVAEIVYLKDADPRTRARLWDKAKAVLAWAPHQELTRQEEEQLEKVSFMQLLSAGVDHVDFRRLPENLVVASNVGAYARPMAEHVLAMVLALSKRLLFHQERLKQGIFDQFSENRAITGMTAAILGFGGIGKEVARLFRVFDMRLLVINRSGKTDEPVDFVGTLADLDEVLPQADILVLSLPLNRETRGILGQKEFKRMKRDAILVNVARGEVIDEEAFYQHLKETPTFMAGIDAWWTEPIRHGVFEMRFPFMELPNVLGTPHNSAIVPGALSSGAQRAAENVRRFLSGKPVRGLVRREDYLEA